MNSSIKLLNIVQSIIPQPELTLDHSDSGLLTYRECVTPL